MGPMTGWGAGNCAGNPGAGNGRGFGGGGGRRMGGRGRGQGQGMGQGMGGGGRRFQNPIGTPAPAGPMQAGIPQPVSPIQPAPITPQDEKAMLMQQAEVLQHELEMIRARLNEMNPAEPE